MPHLDPPQLTIQMRCSTFSERGVTYKITVSHFYLSFNSLIRSPSTFYATGVISPDLINTFTY